MRQNISLYLLLLPLILITPMSLAGGWKLYSGNMEIDVRGSSDLDKTYDYFSVRTSDPELPETRFSCSKEYGLKTTIIFEPEASRKSEPQNLKLMVRRSRLAIEGRKSVSVYWNHIRKTRTIQNRQSKAARMLFNAVVNNANFEIKEPLRDMVMIDLPPVDDEFRMFRKLCHITNGS